MSTNHSGSRTVAAPIGVSERAYQSLRQMLATSRILPGEHLREQELSQELGMSRTPVREAIKRLAAEGFLDVKPNKGAVAASWTQEDLEDIFELRALLESHAARRAAARITPAEIAEMESLAESMESAFEMLGSLSHETFAELNVSFHNVVFRASASRLLTSAAEAALHVPLVRRAFVMYNADQFRRSLTHHRELIDALSCGDAEWAASTMKSHILAASSLFVAPQSASGESSA